MVASLLFLFLTVPEPSAASVVLRWKAVDNAVRYELEISPDTSFKSLALQTRVDGTGFRWAELPDKVHFFRVRSVDAEGRLGPYSEVKEIAAVWAPPAFSQPKAGTQILDRGSMLTFDFIPSLLFTSYRIEVASDAAFTQIVLDQSFDAPPIIFPVRTPGPLFYRLYAQNAAGRTAGPSEPQQILFSTETPDLRVDDGLIVPPDTSMELRWSPSYGASFYRVQIASDARFKTLVHEHRTNDKRFVWKPTQSGDLYWRVLAEDAGGRRSAPSLGRKLVVLEAPGAPSSKPVHSVLEDIDAGFALGVYGGIVHSLQASVDVQSGFNLGARVGAGVGDALLLLSLGFMHLPNTFVLSTVPFGEYDFHISDFRLRLGVGPSLNTAFVTGPVAANFFGLGVAALLGVGWAFGQQEVAVEVRYTYAPLRGSTLQVGGIMVALSVWYGSK